MNEKLKEKVKESLSSVLPITLIVLVLSITLVPMEIGTLALFLTGAVLLIFGMGFFQLGAEMSMTPLGEGVGKTLAKREKVWSCSCRSRSVRSLPSQNRICRCLQIRSRPSPTTS